MLQKIFRAQTKRIEDVIKAAKHSEESKRIQGQPHRRRGRKYGIMLDIICTYEYKKALWREMSCRL